jgi:hypothetical protein
MATAAMKTRVARPGPARDAAESPLEFVVCRDRARFGAREGDARLAAA